MLDEILLLLFNCSFINHQVLAIPGKYSSDDLLIIQGSHSSLINFFLGYDTSNFEKKKSLLKSRRLNGNVDTGCNPFCCFSLIFTASWKKIVIPIVLSVPAILIPFAVYYYCRFYKKQDNNAVTVQQGSVHLKRPRGDKKNWTFELQRLS